MELKRRTAKIALVLCVLVGLAIASLFWHGNAPEGNSSSGMGIFLARPAFAQEDEASFLEREAGIAAYTNLGQGINLAAAKASFRTIEKETGTYVVGSVPVPGYEGDEAQDVHCFMHKDGWIVAYYLKDEPTSKIMYWKNWDEKTISTKVEEGLTVAASTTGLAPTDVKYYHFKYPEATKLMMIADQNSFKLTIPSELVIHERSYSTATGNSLSVDGQSIGSGTGLITLSQLKPGVPHGLASSSSSWGVVVALVYQEL